MARGRRPGAQDRGGLVVGWQTGTHLGQRLGHLMDSPFLHTCRDPFPAGLTVSPPSCTHRPYVGSVCP